MEKENIEQLDNNYHKIISNIDKRSAEFLVDILKLEVDKQTRSLITSNTANEDLLFKGGIRTLERMIRNLEKHITKKNQ